MTVGRADHEIAHGALLAELDPERVWGWGTPAGQLRARRRAAVISEGARLGPGVRALEVGCGTGVFTSYFAETGAHLLAMDISEELLARARARNLDSRRVRFLVGRLEDFETAERFDAVIGSSVLHHLELGEALPRLARLLVPGGRFSFAEPNMLNPQIFLERHVPFLRERLHVSPDETALIRWSFARTLARHGFDDIRITPFDWLHPFTPPAAIPVVRTIGGALERVPLVREFAGSLAIQCRQARA